MKKRTLIILILSITALLFASCASTAPEAAAPAEETAVHSIVGSAELKSVEIKAGRIRSESQVKMLVFDLVLKNTSSSPLRYEAMVYIPGVGAGAGFVPAAEDALIQPGEEAKGSVGVLTDSDEFPTTFIMEIIEE